MTRHYPLARGFTVTSGFGYRTDPYPGTHWGTDFGRDGGSGGLPVFACQGGTVVMVGPASGFGQWVVVDHPTADGSGTTVYGHVIPEVRQGQRVEAGQRIARINPDSNTNGGVAPHLHLELHRSVWSQPGPDRLDPLPWLSGATYPGETPTTEPTQGESVTQFGIDVSNHQRNFDFARARAEGFTFATHKITEGTWRDPYWPRAREQMAQHFRDRWGGYVFCKVGTNPDAEADATLAHAGGTDFPLQIDYEDLDRNGNIGDLLARVNALQARGFRLLPIYLPRWYWQGRMGAPDLSGLPVPIWNSDYVNGGGFASQLYPGDNYKGWAPIGGKDVAILQFSESASVAGQQIDVNAYRGTELQLAALFAGIPNLEEAIMSKADEELGKKFPSRSKYRKDNEPVDTLAGFVLNIDARIHEEHVEREAVKGVGWAVDLVKREAAKGDAGAKATLAQIGSK
ncbi:peptidoglycan DD-metalloendopeptidase family protein [Antrihabitans sp. NCIMB 15449]|uniref:Peptidoglycan DD-metalloendopeptidase family protein n=1 Tax=Antrihabitans spumae TaxID=3373370 RepID=A0ABW7JWX3_9NOCA